MRDADQRGEGGVRAARLDAADVGRLDAKALGGLFDRPLELLSQLAHLMTQLHRQATEGGGLAMVRGLRNPFTGCGHGIRLVFLNPDDEIFNDLRPLCGSLVQADLTGLGAYLGPPPCATSAVRAGSFSQP